MYCLIDNTGNIVKIKQNSKISFDKLEDLVKEVKTSKLYRECEYSFNYNYKVCEIKTADIGYKFEIPEPQRVSNKVNKTNFIKSVKTWLKFDTDIPFEYKFNDDITIKITSDNCKLYSVWANNLNYTSKFGKTQMVCRAYALLLQNVARTELTNCLTSIFTFVKEDVEGLDDWIYYCYILTDDKPKIDICHKSDWDKVKYREITLL